MEINRHNYEAYLLDLLEGRLSVEDKQALETFLLLNPDCDGELTELEPWVLEGEKHSYQKGSLLKKELPDETSVLSERNFDLFSVARIEGDLSQEQIGAHQTMLGLDERKAQQWDQWQRSRLIPEEIEFAGKQSLFRKQKGAKIRVIWMSAVSAAAAIAFVVVLLKMGSGLPQGLSENQITPEAVPELSSPLPADIKTAGPEPLENQSLETYAAQESQKSREPVLFSVSLNTDRPPELISQADQFAQTEPQPQPRLLAISAARFNTTSMASEAVPDHIEPLQIPPVPVQTTRMSIAQISDFDLQEMIEDYTEEKDISFLKVASAGIKGINKLAGSDISLLASRDEEGDVSGFRLKSKRFSLTRPIGQED